jgi:hypothetical protein
LAIRITFRRTANQSLANCISPAALNLKVDIIDFLVTAAKTFVECLEQVYIFKPLGQWMRITAGVWYGPGITQRSPPFRDTESHSCRYGPRFERIEQRLEDILR